AAAPEIARRVLWNPEFLIRYQEKLILRKASRHGQAQLRGVAGESAARQSQGCGFDGYAHPTPSPSWLGMDSGIKRHTEPPPSGSSFLGSCTVPTYAAFPNRN